MITFAVIAYALTLSTQHFMVPETSDIFLILVPGVLILGIVTGNVFFKKLNAAASKAASLKQKISVAFTSSIFRYAFVEGAVLISIIAFLGSANLFYFVFTLIGILYYVTLRPTDRKLRKDLSLTSDEIQETDIQ